MNKKLIKFYIEVSTPYRLHILLLFVFPIIWCIAETSAPYVIKVVIDNLSFLEFDNTSLLQAIAIYFILMAIMETAIRCCSFLWLKFIPKLRSDFRNKILSKVLNQSISYFQENSAGDLISKYKNLSNSFDKILSCFLYGIFPVFISALVAIAFLININFMFSVFFIFWFIGMNLITFAFARKSILSSDLYATSENKLLGHIGDLFRNILLIKTFLGYKLDDRLTIQLQQVEISNAVDLEWVTYKADSLRSIISIIMLLAMVTLLGVGWKNNQLTLGDFSFITAICFYVRRSAWIASINILNLFKEIGVAIEALDQLTNIDVIKKEFISDASIIDLNIKFNSVTFSYDKKNILFNNLILSINPTERVLLIGKSGSGKTTLAYLLLNLFQFTKGLVTIGDYPVEKIPTEQLLKIVSYVSQSSLLFNRTIRENIIYGDPQATETELLDAAKKVEAHDFISKLEYKYDSIVGESGAKLSGGQCQRISLARALLKRSPILILDEATSAIDASIEKQIIKNIISDKQIKIIIMITHHYKNIDLFDRVLFLDRGVISFDSNIKDLPSNWDPNRLLNDNDIYKAKE